MKKNALLSILILLIHGTIYCQETQQLSIAGGTPVNSVLKPEMQNVFPNFTNGEVLFLNHQIVKGKFNYNFLVDEIQFPNEKGEVLALSNPTEISLVTIEKKVFMYLSKGYYEILESGKCSLLLKRKCKILYYGKKGAYGQTAHGASIDQYSSLSINGSVTQVNTEKEAIAKIDYSHFLLIGKKLIAAENEKGFVKAFSKNKSQVTQYIHEFPVDFTKNEDLIRLTKFCNGLN